MPQRQTLKLLVKSSAILLLPMLYSNSAVALNISQSPLYLGAQVKPNIMLIIDDSGSMDSEVLLPTNDGALWWNTSDKSFVGRDANDGVSPGVINFNEAGTAGSTWKKYVYLFPNGTGTGNRVYSDNTHDHYAVPPIAPYAFVRSPDYNGMYYDPDETYQPWISDGGYTFSNASASAAQSDPVRGSGTLNLSSNMESSSGNWVFKMHEGMIIPKGTRYRDTDNVWKTAASDIQLTGNQDVPISYYPATYYLKTSNGSYSVKVAGVPVTGSCGTPDASHYVGFTQSPGDFSSADVNALAPDGGCLKRYEIKSGNTFPSGRTYADELQNFANWFSYYRKRHIALRAGTGRAFDDLSFLRAGGFRINNRSLQGMWDFDVTAERSSLYNFLYNAVGSGGTPNRKALNYAGQQFNTNNNVITYSCQQNFSLLFTDGFAVPDTSSGVGNADGNKGSPYEDSYSNTMADIAMHYYAMVLQSNLDEGNVPISSRCGNANAPAWLDCNNHLHMVTYGITLGAQGHLFGVTHNDIEDAYANSPTWVNPTESRNPVQVDDLYHATINGRGEMLNAKTATELQTALQTALTSIISRGTSTSASIATNSTRLDTDTLIYQAKFDSTNWSGRLLAYQIEADGSILNPDADDNLEEHAAWDTDNVGSIPTAANRKIFTWNGSAGVEFKTSAWSNLSASQKSALQSGGTEDDGKDRLNWIRGDQSKEQPSGPFRTRDRVLGDIVNSNPAYDGDVNFGYDDGGYETHRNRQKTKMLYVGANDGMLHAFDATTGVEKFAFIPSAVFPNLANLSDPGYTHQYFVDGSPQAGDANILGGWKTILVGNSGAGARSVFALDVTDPNSFDQTKVLWEFTDPDLGYPIGQFVQPVIGRMQNGDWAVVFGNGYQSDNHRAFLFVVNLATGALIKKIDTEAGSAGSSNGMAGPVLLADDSRNIKYAYAGDLLGNLWKFDLSSSNINSWASAFKQGSTPKPLFQPRYVSGGTEVIQPITAPPEIGKHPQGGYMIIFGSGKYFEVGDNSGTAVQSLYGVWDKDTTTSRITETDRSPLVERQILAEQSANGNNWRVVSKDIGCTDKLGWYLDLTTPPPPGTPEGERVVSVPLLRHNRSIFTTLIPSSEPCEAGGTSWILEVDTLLSCGGTDAPIFDVNDDGKIDAADVITIDGVSVYPSGIQSTVGIINTPSVISAGPIEFKFAGGSTGGIMNVPEAGDENAGRQSWRQLR